MKEDVGLVAVPLDPARYDATEAASVGIAGAGKHRGWANVEVAISNGHEDRLAFALIRILLGAPM